MLFLILKYVVDNEYAADEHINFHELAWWLFINSVKQILKRFQTLQKWENKMLIPQGMSIHHMSNIYIYNNPSLFHGANAMETTDTYFYYCLKGYVPIILSNVVWNELIITKCSNHC